jgi:hypothetical protein
MRFDYVGFLVLFGKHILPEGFTASDPKQSLRLREGDLQARATFGKSPHISDLFGRVLSWFRVLS